jgi:hypothetical protein
MPSPFTYHRFIVAYHGCDRKVAEKVIFGDMELKKSKNTYDWLGEGIYFWEQGLERAAEWARELHKRGKIEEPAVIGAYIHLGRCFDLTDVWAVDRLSEHYKALKAHLESLGMPLPVNKQRGKDDPDFLLRNLDCAVINFCLGRYDRKSDTGAPYFQTVRGVFVEGQAAYPAGC